MPKISACTSSACNRRPATEPVLPASVSVVVDAVLVIVPLPSTVRPSLTIVPVTSMPVEVVANFTLPS